MFTLRGPYRDRSKKKFEKSMHRISNSCSDFHDCGCLKIKENTQIIKLTFTFSGKSNGLPRKESLL